jgi:hypothetical protein
MLPPLAILHVDMDAFFASVEQRDRPELRGRPVIVCGGPGDRGVVCAASYEARAFGVHSAMPARVARRLCPDGAFLPVRIGHYAGVTRRLRDVFLSFTALMEMVSLDEAYLDVRGSVGHFGPAPLLARMLKDRVRAETGLTASVGVAATSSWPNWRATCASRTGWSSSTRPARPSCWRPFRSSACGASAPRASSACTRWGCAPSDRLPLRPSACWSSTSARAAGNFGGWRGASTRGRWCPTRRRSR